MARMRSRSTMDRPGSVWDNSVREGLSVLRTMFSHPFRSRVAALVAVGGALLAATPAGAPILPKNVLKSFFLEGPGSTATQPYTTDTEILLTYTAGLGGAPSGSGTTTALHLYDSRGEPLTSGTGEVVCAPCLFQNGPGVSPPRRVSVSIEDLIMAHGGFASGNQAQQGFVVLDVTGDTNHLTADARIRTTLATAGQPSVVPIKPRSILEDPFENGDAPSLYVKSKLDGISDWDVSDWAILSATYLGGVAGLPAGAGATVELYLYNDNGSPIGGLASPVCAPCSYALGNGGTGAPRNIELRLPPTPTTSWQGFAVIRVAGADPSSVVLEETAVDSIPGTIPALEIISSHVMEPLVPTGSTTGAQEPDVSGLALGLRSSPNPAGGEITFAFDLVRATTMGLDVFDTAGRRVATVDSGRRSTGHHEVRWNRRDAAGNRLAAGVYYGRLRANDGSRITRVVFLPE